MRFSQSLGTSGLAGAVRFELAARGFGVDVGKCSKEQGRASVARFLPQVTKRAVLVWCYEEAKKRISNNRFDKTTAHME